MLTAQKTVEEKPVTSWMRIPLTQGKSTVVDLDDFLWLSKWKWHYHVAKGRKDGYAARTLTCIEENCPEERHIVWMHREIMGASADMQVDHKRFNGIVDTLDNRSARLRMATSSQNAFNRKTRKDSVTGYKGVHKSSVNRWTATIGMNGERLYLGSFKSIKEAVLARNRAALKYHGEFANMDDVQEINLIKDKE